MRKKIVVFIVFLFIGFFLFPSATLACKITTDPASSPDPKGWHKYDNPKIILTLETSDPVIGNPRFVEQREDGSFRARKFFMTGSTTSIVDSNFQFDQGGNWRLALVDQLSVGTDKTICEAFFKVDMVPWIPIKHDCFTTVVSGAPTTVHGVKTAIGCIPTDNLTEFLKFNLKYVFMIAGLIIFSVALVTGFTLLTSSGKPETLATIKENFTALLAGLALIVFSLILLQTIGKDILGLPSF
jgi:hypothetical protein